MAFGKFLSLKRIVERELICEDATVRKLICDWTKNENWSFNIFVSIMKKLGLKTPMRVRTTGEDAFSCMDGNGNRYQVSLRFSDPIDFPSMLFLTQGKKTNNYTIWKGKSCLEPFRIEEGSTVIRQMWDSKKLESTYSKYFCEHILTIGKEYFLTIKINEPNWLAKPDDEKDRKVLQNTEKIEEYLKTLQFPVSVKEVFGKILELLEFTEKDLRECDVAFVATQERPKNGNRCIQDFYMLKWGKSQGYDQLMHEFSFPVG